ncbi:DUF4197 domain-containing protein [Croceibacterium sp. TMG7-5b_MA50]|uniref:DUF4197 domain-containing protein n=1 Tax=Croceibacterium sp. TMG7-5b_MA50 TaxID=3121290 RepID=UPI0032214814
MAASPVPTRRTVMAGALAAGLAAALPLGLAGCAAGGPGISLTEAVRRLLLLSSERAFARLTAPGGYWDEALARADLSDRMGARGDALTRVLASPLFRQRMGDVFAGAAIDASYRAAPVVTDAVRTIGISNALAIVNGGPSAATQYLRGELGGRLLSVLLPEVDEVLGALSDPLLGGLLNAATGVDSAAIVRGLATTVEDTIWSEIGREEGGIRADPVGTRDPVLTGVFGAAAAL